MDDGSMKKKKKKIGSILKMSPNPKIFLDLSSKILLGRLTRLKNKY